MKYVISLSCLAFALLAAPVANAHPNGTYIIDNNPQVTVTFLVTGRCPTDVEGALRGSIRTLTFSETAVADPYNFVTGTYVEIHDESGEVYIETDSRCVPVSEGEAIQASHDTFEEYSLRRAN